MPGWWWPTRWGKFQIVQKANGRWHAAFEGESLGSYHSAVAAHDDLVGNHCFSNRAGLDTSRIGLPRDLREWNPSR